MFGFGADDYFRYKYFWELVGDAIVAVLIIITVFGSVIGFAIGEVSAKRKEKLLIKNGFKRIGDYWVGNNLSLHERTVQKMPYKKLKQRVIQ